jgi:hypothetical protein
MHATNLPTRDLLLLSICVARKFLMDAQHYMAACKINMRSTDLEDLHCF